MGFGVIIIGDEILSGRRADKHLPKIIELLAARGLSLEWAEYIGDDPARITATLRARSRRATSCFRPAASAPRPTTTRGDVPRKRSACRWNCIRRLRN